MRKRRKGKRVRGEDGNLVRILFAGHHTCIRVIKQARSLNKLGYRIDVLTNTISYGTTEFVSMYFFHNKPQFMNVMKDVGHLYDLVVWHNEPNEMAVWFHESREKNGHKYKIITDWHDINSVRIGRADKEEIKLFRLMDGFVFVSEPCRKLSKDLYDFKQPSAVFSHYCNREWDGYKNYVPGKEDIEKRHGIVYEGGMNVPDHLAPPGQMQAFRYRTIYPLFKEAVANGNEVVIFSGNPEGFQTHQDIGAVIYPPTEYNTLMTEMQKFKWGWTLFGDSDDPQTKNTNCNKIYEYIKSGCVPIVCWADETEKLIRNLECGIVLNDPKELGNIDQKFGDLYPKLKARVDEINTTGELDSEEHIHIIESLWSKIIKE